MIFGIKPKWRRAPVIIFLCYIFVHFNNIVYCIHLIPSYKLSFVCYKWPNRFRTPPEVGDFEPLVSLREHTDHSFELNSSFTNNLFNKPFFSKNPFNKSFFSNIFPNKSLFLNNLFNKPFFNNYAKPCNKNDESILSNFWSSLKSYVSSKFSTVKGSTLCGNPKRYTKSDAYLRNNDLRHLSFFDFFDNAPNNLGDYKIRKEFNESMTQESPYMELVRTGPSGIIKRFLRVAPSMVKDAISLTVSTLIGSFYRYSAETTIITTTDRLAALILNLQVTGYIYCNAEQRYRLSSLCNTTGTSVPGGAMNNQLTDNQPEPRDEIEGLSVGDELLSYVRRLPRSYINGIFDNMNPEILYAMRHSTEKAIQLLTVLNHNYLDFKDDQKLIIQQTGSFAMQLCFWKLALGYCMRDQETKIELTKSLNSH
uniref:Uncharacterized protein n=1 Tax=Theileria annulata TaxID=5874 RepID=A0A3B0MF54_THEAN